MFEMFKKQYMCGRCGSSFGFTRLRRHFEKCEQGLGSSAATWMFGEHLIFNDDGRAWCPECFPDPESIRRGYRSVYRLNDAEVMRPVKTFANFGSE